MTQNPLTIIIKALLKLDNYNAYRIYVEDKSLSKEVASLYKILDSLIETHKRDITFDEFYITAISDNTEHDAILSLIKDSNVADEIILELLEQSKKKVLAHEIALLAIDVSEGKKAFELLKEQIEKHSDDKKVTDEFEFVTDSLKDLYERQVHTHGLRWRLHTLNRMLGSLRKGNFGFLFARPETGKTTFLASEVTYMATQLSAEDGPILWFNNEEEGEKVKLRLFQAALGIELVELFSDMDRNEERYLEITRNKIKLIDSANISRRQVENMCKKLQPSLIIFDQLDKIKGFDGDREDLRLGYIYQWAREIAKTYGPVIAVSQSDGSGEGKKWLTMENVANAKTAKQAEADWILGIGATHAEGFEFVRHLHLSKNKLTGDEDSDPDLRHGKCDVLIKPQIARYEDYT